MRVTCPACEAAYEVPQDKLETGKRLRCARCGKEWQAVAPAPEPVPTPVVPAPSYQLDRPAHVVALRQADATARGGAGAGLWAAWALTVLVLAGCAWGAYAYRAQVMQAWPPSQRAYAAVGLEK